jgi:hypothetical protein
MSSRKKILIISYSHLNSDPRVRRQIKALAEKFDIHTGGLSPVEFGNFPFYRIDTDTDFKYKPIVFHLNKPFAIRKFLSLMIILRGFLVRTRNKWRQKVFYSLFPLKYLWLVYWDDSKKDLVDEYKRQRFDAVLANDMIAVPVAYEIAKETGARLIFDAHEYSPGENDSNEEWVKFTKPLIYDICYKYLPKVDIMFTVCQGIADEYEKIFGKRSIVITNATDYYSLEPVAPEKDKIKMVHHGAAIAERHIDLMIKLVDLLDERFTLDLILMPTQAAYYNEIKEMIRNNPRIKMLPAVKTEEIPTKTNHYDLGLFLLPPVNLNYHFALPNKLFEFIQARLAVAIGPSPEMKRIVEEHDLGIVSKNFELKEIAAALNALDAETLLRYKKNANTCASVLNSSANAHIMIQAISRLLKVEEPVPPVA